MVKTTNAKSTVCIVSVHRPLKKCRLRIKLTSPGEMCIFLEMPPTACEELILEACVAPAGQCEEVSSSWEARSSSTGDHDDEMAPAGDAQERVQQTKRDDRVSA